MPAPVVTVDPGVIDLSNLINPGDAQQFNFTITNHGLIAAQGVAFQFGVNDIYEFTPLVPDVGELPAMSSVTVPVIVTRIGAATESSGSVQAALLSVGAGGPLAANAGLCFIPGSVIYKYVCGNDGITRAVQIGITGRNSRTAAALCRSEAVVVVAASSTLARRAALPGMW